jgi:septal ring factor EnvC (AmiA/AmiB activator)
MELFKILCNLPGTQLSELGAMLFTLISLTVCMTRLVILPDFRAKDALKNARIAQLGRDLHGSRTENATLTLTIKSLMVTVERATQAACDGTSAAAVLTGDVRELNQRIAAMEEKEGQAAVRKELSKLKKFRNRFLGDGKVFDAEFVN